MQEEVNQKTISIIIKGGRISGDILKNSLKYFLAEIKKQGTKNNAKKSSRQAASQNQEGKQTLKQLKSQGKDLTNIQITNKNIGSFDRYARKYFVDYALKKDKSTSPPTYYVFFKAKDVDSMTAAFTEYTNSFSRKQSRPSVRAKLVKALEVVKNTLSQQKERNKHHERSR